MISYFVSFIEDWIEWFLCMLVGIIYRYSLCCCLRFYRKLVGIQSLKYKEGKGKWVCVSLYVYIMCM